jgi:hypothetical protein
MSNSTLSERVATGFCTQVGKVQDPYPRMRFGAAGSSSGTVNAVSLFNSCTSYMNNRKTYTIIYNTMFSFTGISNLHLQNTHFISTTLTILNTHLGRHLHVQPQHQYGSDNDHLPWFYADTFQIF